MGLFDRFKKQDCEICGKEVGMFGYKKLEDGEICKDCVKLLSPWFDDRRHSTVAQIKEQLVYREKNKAELGGFHVSRVIGESYKMYIEEVNGVPTRFFVTDANNYMEANPDIISFKDVMSCVTDIESRQEEMKRDDGKGNRVSYTPPRYKVHYNFHIDMGIANNPYFSKIRFSVNRGVVTLEMTGAMGFGGGLFGGSRAVPMGGGFGDMRDRQRYHEYEAMCQEIEQTVRESKMVATAVAAAQAASAAAPAAAPAPAPAPAPAGPKFCPNCGAPADGGKFCQSCGSKLA